MKSERGQSLVETALVIPILIILLFGITDFGRVFHTYLTLDHAGREGARAASIGKSDSEVRSKIASGTSSLKGSVNIEFSSSGNSGDDATITLTYPFEFLTPIISGLDGFEVKNTTVMRVE